MKDDHLFRVLRMMIAINYACLKPNGAKKEFQFGTLSYPVQK